MSSYLRRSRSRLKIGEMQSGNSQCLVSKTLDAILGIRSGDEACESHPIRYCGREDDMRRVFV